MKKLDLHNAAIDLARATLGFDTFAHETALAAKGKELKLTDPEYAQFKGNANQHRGLLLGIRTEDDRAAKAAAGKLATASSAQPKK